MAYIMLGRKPGAYANAWCSTHRQGFDNLVRGEMQVPTRAAPIGGRGAPLRPGSVWRLLRDVGYMHNRVSFCRVQLLHKPRSA